MNVTVKDIMGFKGHPGHVGIEVEVECLKEPPPIVKTKWWNSKADNSLRNGIEYVNTEPLPVDKDKLHRIMKLTEAVDTKANPVAKDSHRTSIHVHNNVVNDTPVQVWTEATAYWLVENLLFKYFGKEREGLLFCLRLMDAEYIIGEAIEDVSKPESAFMTVTTDALRYAGMNLNTISRFGSLELRGMRGTIDPVIIDQWSTGSWELFQNAKKNFATPAALLDFFYFNGHVKTVEKLFNPGALRDFLLAIKKGDELVEHNACILAPFAYCTSWDAYTKKINERFKVLAPKPKKDKAALMEDFINRQAFADEPQPVVDLQMPIWAQEVIAAPARARRNPPAQRPAPLANDWWGA